MCGIVGYIGTEQAAPIILDGLSKLEYRGYDSAGMAIFDGEKINTKKAVGRLKVLENLTHGGESMKGTSGIGHTRWATHGAPSDINSHPHMNNAGTIAVVHNGIIENYIPLKKKMQDKGYQFISETDTEVLAHLLDYYYKGNPLEAITKVLHRVEGSYALGIMFADQPDKIFAARKDSPLIVGKSESGSFIASDVPAILKYTRTVYYVDNQEVVELKEDGLRFFSVDEEEITKTPVTIDWDANAAEKGGYEHFMLKEIYEQPKTINDTISPRIKDNDIVIEELNMSDEEIQEITKIHIVDIDGKTIKEYQKSGRYIMDTEIKGSILEMTLGKRSGNKIQKTNTKDYIRYKEEEAEDAVTLTSKYTDTYWTQLYFKFPNYIYIQVVPDLLLTKIMVNEDDVTLKLSNSGEQVEQYYVYASGVQKAVYTNLTEAIARAYEERGNVIDSKENILWKCIYADYAQVAGMDNVIKTGTDSTSLAGCLSMIAAVNGKEVTPGSINIKKDNIEELMKKYSDHTTRNLTGCTVDEILYYVSQGSPVLAKISSSRYVIVMSYNATKIRYLDPVTGQSTAVSRTEVTNRLEKTGKVFYSYLIH